MFASVAEDICMFVHPDDSHRVGLTMSVNDMAAFQAVLQSEAGAAAMKYDGVIPDTVVMLVQQ